LFEEVDDFWQAIKARLIKETAKKEINFIGLELPPVIDAEKKFLLCPALSFCYVSTPMLKLTALGKTFGTVDALRPLDLEVPNGEFFSLLGPSGCGKTTLLRLLGGFEKPTSGQIWIDDRRIDELPPHQRQFNTVFQRYALFPHLSVFQNVAFGLQMKKVSADEVKVRVVQALELVQMTGFESRSTSTLSGGQQQRIAVARALINRPKILLLDEPLSALDEKLRQQMKIELLSLQRKLKQTFIFVTHDQEEALTISDRIAVMNKGIVEQVGTPQEIYEYPRTLFVAQFIGSMNVIEGVVKGADMQSIVVDSASRRPVLIRPTRDGLRPLPKVFEGLKVQVMIRPEKLKVLRSQPGFEQNSIEATIKEVLYKGPVTQFILQAKEEALPTFTAVQVNTALSAKKSLGIGDRVFVAWLPEDCILMGETGALPLPEVSETPLDIIFEERSRGAEIVH